MAQINVHLSPEFEQALARFRRLRKLPSKSEAVRVAVREALEREERRQRRGPVWELRGFALRAPLDPAPRFSREDELWEKDLGRR